MKKDKNKTSAENEHNKPSTVRTPVKGDVVSGFKTDDLNSELERLAEVFREELKNRNELPEEEFLKDEKGIIYEDEVCQCCGEKRKAKDSDYCKSCREAMRRYPLERSTVAVAVIMVVFAVFSLFNFLDDFDGYYVARKAKNEAADRNMYSSVDYYREAINIFETEGINAKFLKFECADAMYEVMAGSDDLLTMLSSAFEDYEVGLPIYAHRVEMYDEVYVLKQTLNDMLEIYETYKTGKTDDEVYENGLAAIEALLENEYSFVSIDGETKTYPASEAAVRYCQYTYAYLMQKTEDVYYYVELTCETGSQYLCMYGYDLGIVYAQTRDFGKAVTVADALLDNNTEDGSAYCIYSAVERMKGNYDKAIEWTERGLEKCPADTELMRHAAMAYTAKGDYENAKIVIDEAISYADSDLVYPVAIVIENELGNSDTVQTYLDMFESAGAEVPQKITDYLDGKTTAARIFTEGTGEAQ